MKTILSILIIAACCVTASAAESVKETLQKGLFEEEANRNFEAAAQAYRSVITSYDQNRQLTATAIFRLAECYRKLGKTNEATAQYERIVREFSDQTALADLSRRFTVRQLPAAPTIPPEPESSFTSRLQASIQAVEINRIQELVKSSPDLLNARQSDGKTLLHRAAEQGQLATVQFLVKAGADIDLPDSGGDTPLHTAVLSGHKAVVEFLVQSGADINRPAQMSPANTPLGRATMQGFKEVAEVLLAHGADPAKQSADGMTPMHIAAVKGYDALIETLINARVSVNIRTASGFTPLHLAAQQGNLRTVKFILSRGADINARPTSQKEGPTPLLLALNYGRDIRSVPGGQKSKPAPSLYCPIIALLITNKADVNAVTTNGTTPLIYAVRADDVPTIELLLTHGANIDARDHEGRSALFHAALLNQTNALAFLLSQKINPDAKGPHGLTALHIAAHQGLTNTVSLLLKYKANPNALDDSNSTPLHYAAFAARKPVVSQLIARRADPGIKNQKGFTAYALSSNTESVAGVDPEILQTLYPQFPLNPQVLADTRPSENRQDTTLMLLRYTREREAMLVPRDPPKK